jgi:hypothetical protein
LTLSNRGPEAAADPVADDGVADVPSHRVRDACRPGVGAGDPTQAEGPASAGTSSGQRLEGATVADRPGQAPRRLRPRARRALSTARPPRVRIRPRKPCVLLRRRLLGWNVRFTHGLLGAGARLLGLPPGEGRGATERARRELGISVRATRTESQRARPAASARGRDWSRRRGGPPRREPARPPVRVLSLRAAGATFRARRRSGLARCTSPRGFASTADKPSGGAGALRRHSVLHNCGSACGQPGPDRTAPR